MITATLRIELTDGLWVADVSQSFPEATFRLLSGVRTGNTAVELGEVRTKEPARVSNEIASHPAVLEHTQLSQTSTRAVAKYETTDTGLYEFVENETLPPEFPIVVQNGWYELDFTGRRARFEALRDGLERADRTYELQSLLTTTDRSEILTDRQQTVLETATRMGYFEVPRKCTLKEVASTLEVDKSTASETVRRAQARVISWYYASDEG